MAHPELGTKRICPTTGRKFYDLGKNPVVSPYTGEIVPIAAPTTFGRVPAPVVARRPAPPDEEAEREGPELVSLDEIEAEEDGKDTDAEAEGDDALSIDDAGDDDASNDDTLIDDEDEDATTDLVDVDDDEEDS